MSDEDRPAPTPRYRRVPASSTEVAREMGHSYVGVEHLFLAIIRDRDSVPTQALAQRLDLDLVEAGLVREMASSGYTGQRGVVPAQRAGGAAGRCAPWYLARVERGG